MDIGTETSLGQALAGGWALVSGEDLQRLLVGNTAWGDYPGGFRFVSYLDPDGTCIGTNNVGSDNTGMWAIDFDNDTLSTHWDHGWLATTTHAVMRDGVIHCFDVGTGNWRTSFTRILPERRPLIV